MSNHTSQNWIDGIEETLIAAILGLMTLVTFVNVVLRYLFNESLIWGLEVVLILFAWLVLLGMSYAMKKTAHLGVDAITSLLAPSPRRVVAVIAGLACVLYAALLMKGAWDYWAPFAGLQPTTGRFIPGIESIGGTEGFKLAEGVFTEGVRDRAFYVTDQVPMPGILRWLEGAINYGEEYEKLPRVVPYLVLPFGAGLFLLRCVQALIAVIRGVRDSLIVSHEAEEAVAEAAVAELSANPDPYHRER
ncbi:MAG: TRAP transporter permease DctQ [Rhodobacterales bacterium]|nr:MAG: TRAP transporter permease DctQ [Rhodobacterales bacterium]